MTTGDPGQNRSVHLSLSKAPFSASRTKGNGHTREPKSFHLSTRKHLTVWVTQLPREAVDPHSWKIHKNHVDRGLGKEMAPLDWRCRTVDFQRSPPTSTRLWLGEFLSDLCSSMTSRKEFPAPHSECHTENTAVRPRWGWEYSSFTPIHFEPMKSRFVWTFPIKNKQNPTLTYSLTPRNPKLFWSYNQQNPKRCYCWLVQLVNSVHSLPVPQHQPHLFHKTITTLEKRWHQWGSKTVDAQY